MPAHRSFPPLAILALLTTFILQPLTAAAETYHAYIGTYTGGSSEGIYHCLFDTESGNLSQPQLVAKLQNPSFLAVHPNQKLLYAVGENADLDYQGTPSGSLHAFQIDTRTGGLTELNSTVSGGGAPCHLNVDASGKFLLTANYVGGNVSVTRIRDNGYLGSMVSLIQHTGKSINPRRQEKPHAHSVNLDAQNQFAFVADLGIDQLKSYRLDSKTGALTSHSSVAMEPGSGPRHFCFHPSGKYAYVINELSLTITAMLYDASTGTLDKIQTLSTLPQDIEDRKGMSTAEIVAHPSGKFLFGSNRGHDSISVFAIDPQTGKLNQVQNIATGGKTPRNFVVDPSGRYLLAENQNSDRITSFKISPITGHLQPLDQAIQVGNPVCIRFVKKD